MSFNFLASMLKYRLFFCFAILFITCSCHLGVKSFRTELFRFVLENKANELSNLVKHNPDSAAYYLETSGCELLCKAASRGNLDVVKFLLKKKVDINCNESSPLFYASSMGRAAMVRFLSENGSLLQPKGYRGESCLHVAAGTNPGRWVEQHDIENLDHPEVVKILVEYGEKVDVADRFGETPLMRAAFVQNYEIAKYLISQNADVTRRNTYGETALHKAAFTNKDNRTCALLLENGANASSKDTNGTSPVLGSMIKGMDTSTLRLFVAYGYDPVQDVNNKGQTLLHRALEFRHIPIVDFLLDRHADVNAADYMGTTPMHLAAKLRGALGLRIIQRLLDAGAYINPVDGAGHTPLFYIFEIVHSDHGTYYPDSTVLNFLKANGAIE